VGIGTLPCDWSRVLGWLLLLSVRFDGGSLQLEAETFPDDGIVEIGTDAVALIHRDRQYWIPFAALLDVTGTCRPTRNPEGSWSLRSVVTGWIDPAQEALQPDELIWHAFITRTGSSHSGVVREVDDAGILVETRSDSKWVRIPWKEVAAAVELLE